MNVLRDQHLLILGLGDSGLAMARWAARCGAARIVVADTREAPPQAAALAARAPGAELRCGAFSTTLLDGIQLVLKSPGLGPTDPAVAPLLEAAGERGVLVLGELALFAHALRDLRAAHGYAPKVLAITGTNGKTTTTSMTAQLVERTGAQVAMAGNIGPTLLDTLADALDRQGFEASRERATEACEVASGEGPAHADEPGPLAVPDDAPVVPAPGLPGDPVDEAAAGTDADAASAAGLAEPVGADASTLLDDQAYEDVLESAGGPPPHLVPPPPPPPRFEHLPDVWVLELSSFQLDGVHNFEPTAATVLNVTQDHLDWHGSMAAYAAAKQRIFGREAILVINRDDPLVEAMTVPPPEPVVLNRYGKPKAVKPVKGPGRTIVRFGLDAPRRPGDFGLVVENGMAWLVRAHPADETQKRRKGEDEEILLQRLMPADALRVRGRHNAANALAALALATAAGLPMAPMLHGLREYAGEPHRVEFVRTVGDIEAFDDSKGTNVGATVAALNGLGADKSPARLVLILGGDGKGQDFTPLAAPVALYGRAVALIGRDAQAIRRALGDTVAGTEIVAEAPEAAGPGVLPAARFDTLEAATRWAFEQARPGDAVLLSPACASLDMFRNYAHRAQVFIDAVQALAEERGEMAG